MKRKPQIEFGQQLNTAPVRNAKVKIEPSKTDAEALVVEVELRYSGLMSKVASFVRARDHKRYELAGVSRELFEALDGKLTVEDLIDRLCKSDRLTFFESRALVVQYLRDLMQRGLIAIIPAD